MLREVKREGGCHSLASNWHVDGFSALNADVSFLFPEGQRRTN